MDFWDAYDRHASSLRRYAASMLRDKTAADDVIQEVYLRLQRGSGELREPEKITVWLYRVTRNLCLDILRARPVVSLDDPQGSESSLDGDRPTVETEIDRRRMSGCVQEKVELLPEKQREIISLHDIAELSQSEIADLLGISIGNVKVRLHRARQKLQAILKDQCSFTRDDRDVFVCEPSSVKQPRRPRPTVSTSAKDRSN